MDEKNPRPANQQDGHARAPDSPATRSDRALQRVAKWRSILTGRMVGSRERGDPEVEGWRDIFDKLVLLRVETTAITRLLLEKKVFTLDELHIALAEEADYINKAYEQEWPGITAHDDGIHMQLPEARETLARKSQP